jgi:hypothetical protein
MLRSVINSVGQCCFHSSTLSIFALAMAGRQAGRQAGCLQVYSMCLLVQAMPQVIVLIFVSIACSPTLSYYVA